MDEKRTEEEIRITWTPDTGIIATLCQDDLIMEELSVTSDKDIKEVMRWVNDIFEREKANG